MDHFTYNDGALYAEDVCIARIAQEVGTPFYCYSHATLTRHYRVFADALAFCSPLICYAVKANGAVAVIAALAREGAGADVVSAGEIHAALRAGVSPDKIVFSGVGKTRAEMEFALTQNIFQFNVESKEELTLLSQVAKEAGKKARIALRVNPDVEAGTHAKISTGQKESKFGVDIGDALAFYAQAGELPGIKVQGVSVHIGSQLTSLAPFAHAFARLGELVRELRTGGHAITTLDLGGGLGIPYDNQDPPPLPAAYADIVREHAAPLGCQLIFEPGRLIAGNAGILVSRVTYVKRMHDRAIVILDAGMNDLIRPAMYDAFHDMTPVQVRPDAPTELADIVGPVCESSDVFAASRMVRLPEAGDLVALRTAGAYGASMASTYNARPLLAEVMVKGGELAIIRPRQSYDELFARDRLPQWLKA